MWLPMSNIHTHTIIGTDVRLGIGVTVWHFTNITGDVTIDQGTVVGSHCSILGVGRPVKIGKNVRIQSFVFIPGGTVIGDNVFIAPSVTILNDKYPPQPSPDDWSPVVIEDDVVLGGGALVLPGVKIGKGAKIGSGAVVTKDIPAGTIVAGNPARLHHTKWKKD